MAGIDTRALLVAIDPDGNLKPARLDQFGNLRSTASVESVTLGAVTISDALDNTLRARVTAAGNLMVDVSDTEFNVSNFPAEYTIPAAQVADLKVVDVTDRTGRVLGQVAITNWPADYPLPAGQVADLKTVSVDNLPADYPLPAAQVTDLKAVSVENLPADYPLPAAQVASLTNWPTDYPDTLLHGYMDNVEALLAGQNRLLGEDFTVAHQNGLNFVGGERLNFGGSLSTARYIAAVRNPATNTKVAYVYAVVVYTSATQWFRWAINPDITGATTGEGARSLNLANPGVASIEMLWSNTAPVSADYWSAQTRVTLNGGVPLSFPRPVPIPPGVTFAIIGESSASQETCANLYFYEKAIA